MTRKPTNNEQERPACLTMTKAEAESKLQDRIESGNTLLVLDLKTDSDLQIFIDAKHRWSTFNVELLSRMFDNPTYASKYTQLDNMYILGFSSDLAASISQHRTQVKTYVNNLVALKDAIVLIDELPSVRSNVTQPVKQSAIPAHRKVFIVHGHDDALKHEVARVLQQLDLEPIILAEQTDDGNTVIEKFELYSDVWYAVVLLTPDDIGGMNVNSALQKERARQNVILEMGFFMGKLGRSNVCALNKGHVEIPSDINGFIYIPVDGSGNWHLTLARQLKKIGRKDGVEIDMNNLD